MSNVFVEKSRNLNKAENLYILSTQMNNFSFCNYMHLKCGSLLLCSLLIISFNKNRYNYTS